jgi:CRP-like cAMP-binding protein
MNLVNLLHQSTLCRGLDRQELEALSKIVSFRQKSKEELLFLEGDTATGFYILLTGRVRIYKSSPEGKEYTLHSITPGQMFAEVAIFRGNSFPANCIATEDSSVAFIPKDKFSELLACSPQLSLKMIVALAAFIREYNQKVEDLSLREVPARLASYLLQQSEKHGTNFFLLEISKTELATTLGTIIETLSRNFRRLSDSGIIDIQSELVTILDHSRLQGIADGDKL